MKNIFLPIAVASILSLTGCATIVSDSSYGVNISSNPSSQFTIENSSGRTIAQGATPQVVFLDASKGFFSGEKYTVTFNLEGHRSAVIPLNSSIDGWVFGNILLGGIIGLVVDGASGAMYKLDTTAHKNLTPSESASIDGSQINFYQMSDLTDEQKLSLTRIN